MAKIITRTKNKIKANCYLPGKARDAFNRLVYDHDGKIDIIETPFGDRYVATLDEVETATCIANKLNELYASIDWTPVLDCERNAKPAPAKGSTFDFSKIKGKTNSEKNKALHAMLVSKGIKDSRTPEYMSVWNARPWAK
jgi:hypothetical protein